MIKKKYDGKRTTMGNEDSVPFYEQKNAKCDCTCDEHIRLGEARIRKEPDCHKRKQFALDSIQKLPNCNEARKKALRQKIEDTSCPPMTPTANQFCLYGLTITNNVTVGIEKYVTVLLPDGNLVEHFHPNMPHSVKDFLRWMALKAFTLHTKAGPLPDGPVSDPCKHMHVTAEESSDWMRSMLVHIHSARKYTEYVIFQQSSMSVKCVVYLDDFTSYPQGGIPAEFADVDSFQDNVTSRFEDAIKKWESKGKAEKCAKLMPPRECSPAEYSRAPSTLCKRIVWVPTRSASKNDQSRPLHFLCEIGKKRNGQRGIGTTVQPMRRRDRTI